MRVTIPQLRLIIERAVQKSQDEDQVYRCFDGSTVTFGSPECLEDIQLRLDDAIATRDSCVCRTDKRVAYNSLLQMLRREKRSAEKAHRALYPEEGV